MERVFYIWYYVVSIGRLRDMRSHSLVARPFSITYPSMFVIEMYEIPVCFGMLANALICVVLPKLWNTYPQHRARMVATPGKSCGVLFLVRSDEANASSSCRTLDEHRF